MMIGIGHLRPSASMVSEARGLGRGAWARGVARLSAGGFGGVTRLPPSRALPCGTRRPGAVPQSLAADAAGPGSGAGFPATVPVDTVPQRYPGAAGRKHGPSLTCVSARPGDRATRRRDSAGVPAAAAALRGTVSTTGCRTSNSRPGGAGKSSAGKAICESHPQSPATRGPDAAVRRQLRRWVPRAALAVGRDPDHGRLQVHRVHPAGPAAAGHQAGPGRRRPCGRAPGSPPGPSAPSSGA